MIKGGATHLGVATDQVIESFRNHLWAGHKTGEGIEPELWAQFRLLEETLVAALPGRPNLAPHVGHKIQVTGPAVPATEAEADTKLLKARHYMKLTSIKMISTTCP